MGQLALVRMCVLNCYSAPQCLSERLKTNAEIGRQVTVMITVNFMCPKSRPSGTINLLYLRGYKIRTAFHPRLDPEIVYHIQNKTLDLDV